MIPETSEAPAAAPEQDAVVGGTEADGQGAQPEADLDLGREVASLHEKIDRLAGTQESSDDEDLSDADLADLLASYDASEYADEEYLDDDGEAEEGDAEEGETDLTALNSYIEQQVNQRLQPVLRDQQQRERRRELGELSKRYPEIMDREMLEQISTNMNWIAERYGNADLYNDPFLVEQTYLALKAQQASAAEVPATGGSQGASLETGAGPSGGGSDSPEDQIRQSILSVGGTHDAFT